MNLAGLLASTLQTAPLRGLLARRGSLPSELEEAAQRHGLRSFQCDSDDEVHHFLSAAQAVPGALLALYLAPDAAPPRASGPVLVLAGTQARQAAGLDARHAHQWRPMILEAAARSLRSGSPVSVPLALDVLAGAAPEGAERAFYAPPVAPAPTAAAMERIEADVAQAERARWLIGAECAAPKLWREVRALVERSALPAWLTPAARGVLPGDHPLCLGVIRTQRHLALVQTPALAASASGDLLLGLGISHGEREAQSWLRRAADTSTVYLLGTDIADAGERWRGLRGSIAGWLRRLRIQPAAPGPLMPVSPAEFATAAPALEDLKQRWAALTGHPADEAQFMVHGAVLREAVLAQLRWSAPQRWIDLPLHDIAATAAAWRGAAAMQPQAPPLVLYDPRDLLAAPQTPYWQALPLTGLRRASVSSLHARRRLAGASHVD